MKISRSDSLTASDYGVFDAAGQQIPYVVSYDTETQEIEMMLKLQDEEAIPDKDERFLFLVIGADMKPFVAKFVLPGSYAMDRQGNIVK